MIDQYKYTWKMVKPLIPIVFLAAWALLFEDKIWPDWENEIPIKIFQKGELQWEYEMDPDLAKENYRFEFVQFEGNADIFNKDTLIIDKNIYCIMEALDSTEYESISGRSITMKGRVLGYDSITKKFRLDHCFIQSK
tara:strand:- start:41 stop:451 length:411 start_codon:yes stop_codon:yes gene_type:complete